MEELQQEQVDQLDDLNSSKVQRSSSAYISDISISSETDATIKIVQRRKSSASDLERCVNRLRPSKALIQQDSITVTEAVRVMAERRSEATLLVGNDGILSGILTDKDIAFRVVAKGLHPNTTLVSQVMTPDPSCVTSSTSAMAALRTMVSGKFRHLPLTQNGKVVGLLDITKCLYDAISKIESACEVSSSRFSTAIERLERDIGGFGGVNNLFQMMKEKLFLPRVSSLIDPNTTVSQIKASSTVTQAAELMLQDNCSAVMVVDDTGEAIGIFTSKDLLLRTLAPEMDPSTVEVKNVMTRNPDCALMDTTILDALHLMHDGKFLHLPILGEDGRVAGLMDVLQLTYGVVHQMGSLQPSNESSPISESWNNLCSSMLNDANSTISAVSTPIMQVNSSIRDGFYDSYTYKMTDHHGKKHRFSSSADSLAELLKDIRKRIHLQSQKLEVHYLDEENDEVVICTDDDLKIAVLSARSSGHHVIHLVVRDFKKQQESHQDDNYWTKFSNISFVGTATAAITVAGITAAFLHRQS